MREILRGEVQCSGCGEIHQDPEIRYQDQENLSGAEIFCKVLVEWVKPIWGQDD